MIKKFKQSIITALVFSLILSISISVAAPMPPILISGTVTIDDEIASSGVVSVEGGQIIIPITADISGAGIYSIQVPYENNEKELIFKVNDEVATSKIVTSPSQTVNLSISSENAPPPVPEPTCGDGICNGDEICSSCSIDCGACGGGGGGSPTPPVPPEVVPTPEVKGVTDENIIDGDIVQCKSCSNPFAVYIVKQVGDTKYIRHIVSLEIFDYYSHLKWENLKQVDSLDEYSLSGWVRHNTGPNGTAGPTDKVYEINGDQTKHWINMTAEDFLSHGGSEPAIYSVNQGELDLYATGVDVMSL